MNKPFVVLAAILLVLIGVAGWYFGELLTARPGGPPASDTRAAYDQWAASLSADEKAVRDELNDLIAGTKVTLSDDDQTRVGKLTFACDDPAKLLEIGHVASFVRAAGRGETDPYAFVTAEQRPALENLAGKNPSPELVLKLRSALAELAAEFEVLRQKPDWNVEVTGEEKVEMPILDMLREGYEFLPHSKHPAMRANPLVPVFAAGDAELLAQLKTYFNGKRAKAAFPPAKFPNAYVKDTLPAIPAGLSEYRKAAQAAIDAEKKMLLPGDKTPPADAIEAVDDVYRKLERFLDAVGKFGK